MKKQKKLKIIFPGDVAFKLYDTYGFPLDLTQDVLRNKSIKVDIKKFDQTNGPREERMLKKIGKVLAIVRWNIFGLTLEKN